MAKVNFNKKKFSHFKNLQKFYHHIYNTSIIHLLNALVL